MTRKIPLLANSDAFWEFITEDVLPPALPKASCIPLIDVMVTAVDRVTSKRRKEILKCVKTITRAFRFRNPDRGGIRFRTNAVSVTDFFRQS